MAMSVTTVCAVPAEARTIATIAEEAGVSIFRAQYAAKQAKVRPIARAGVVRLFDAEAVTKIKVTLRRIAMRKSLATEESGGNIELGEALTS
jgi:hypothetical protein